MDKINAGAAVIEDPPAELVGASILVKDGLGDALAVRVRSVDREGFVAQHDDGPLTRYPWSAVIAGQTPVKSVEAPRLPQDRYAERVNLQTGEHGRCEFEDLKTGDVFRLFEKDGTSVDGGRVCIARSDAFQDAKGVWGLQAEPLPSDLALPYDSVDDAAGKPHAVDKDEAMRRLREYGRTITPELFPDTATKPESLTQIGELLDIAAPISGGVRETHDPSDCSMPVYAAPFEPESLGQTKKVVDPGDCTCPGFDDVDPDCPVHG
jgi:hypothetical protein